jgi:hypothetical protein
MRFRCVDISGARTKARRDFASKVGQVRTNKRKGQGLDLFRHVCFEYYPNCVSFHIAAEYIPFLRSFCKIR